MDGYCLGCSLGCGSPNTLFVGATLNVVRSHQICNPEARRKKGFLQEKSAIRSSAKGRSLSSSLKGEVLNVVGQGPPFLWRQPIVRSHPIFHGTLLEDMKDLCQRAIRNTELTFAKGRGLDSKANSTWSITIAFDAMADST